MTVCIASMFMDVLIIFSRDEYLKRTNRKPLFSVEEKRTSNFFIKKVEVK